MASYRSSSEEVNPPAGRSWLGRIFIFAIVARSLRQVFVYRSRVVRVATSVEHARARHRDGSG